MTLFWKTFSCKLALLSCSPGSLLWWWHGGGAGLLLGLSWWARAFIKVLSQPLVVLDLKLPNASLPICKYLCMHYDVCISYVWILYICGLCAIIKIMMSATDLSLWEQMSSLYLENIGLPVTCCPEIFPLPLMSGLSSVD